MNTLLSPLQRLALAQATKLSAEERVAIAPGTYQVGFGVTVSGEITVDADDTYTPTSSVPLIPTLALALKKMGIQRTHFLEVLREAMTETLASGEDLRAALVAESGLDEAETSLRAMLKKLPKETRRGKTHARIRATACGYEGSTVQTMALVGPTTVDGFEE